MFRKIVKPAQALFTTTKKQFGNLHNFSTKAGLNATFPSDKQSLINNLRKESASFSSSFLDNLSTPSKLSKNTFSQTHRVFAKDLNRYMSLKTIHLDSPQAWEQMNLILRQKALKKKALAEINSIYFNESDKIVNVLSECSSKVLSDSRRIRNQSKIPWKGDELTLLSWQILHQINAMQQLGGELQSQSSINPQNIFIDAKADLLKLHDFGDFGLIPNPQEEKVQSLLENLSNPSLLNGTILSLVNMISPEEWCRDGEAARRYLETHHSDFMYQLELIESKLREFDEGSKENFASRLENEILKVLGDHKRINENGKESRRESALDVENKTDHIFTGKASKQADQAIKSNEVPNQIEKDNLIPSPNIREQILNEIFNDLDQVFGKKPTIQTGNLEKESITKNFETVDVIQSQTPPLEDAGFKARMEEAVAEDRVCESAIKKPLRRIWQILNLKHSIPLTFYFTTWISLLFAVFWVAFWAATKFEESRYPPNNKGPEPEKVPVSDPVKNPPKQKLTFRDSLRNGLLRLLLFIFIIF